MESFSTLQWYLVRTKPRDEERVIRYLRFAEYPYLFPTYWKTSFAGRKREKKPLFPGYLFVSLILKEAYHNIRYTRGVSGFVRFGSMPVSVPREIVENLKEKMREDGSVSMHSNPLPKGTPVMIMEGPFKGFEGVFEESLNDGQRVAILLKGLNSARVEVDRTSVFTAA